MAWIDCKVDSDYEINTEFSYQIRRKYDQRIIRESVNPNTNYVICHLNSKQYLKHRIIALQFIPNDDPINKIEIDHINKIKTDNRIENIRWCSRSENNKNRASFTKQKIQHVKELPGDWISFELYNGFEFEGYSYSPSKDKFYYDNGSKIRIQNLTKVNGYKIFKARDITGKRRTITVNKWKRDNGF